MWWLAVEERAPLEELAAKVLDANGSVAITANQKILPAGFDTAAAAANTSLTAAQWKTILDHESADRRHAGQPADQSAGGDSGGHGTDRAGADDGRSGGSGVCQSGVDDCGNAQRGIVGVRSCDRGYRRSGSARRDSGSDCGGVADRAPRMRSQTRSFGFPLVGVLSRLNTGGQLNHLAGIASRFLLHGVRQAAGTGTQGVFASDRAGVQLRERE